MLSTLPKSSEEIKNWQWSEFAPYYQELQAQELTENNINEWLTDWTQLSDLLTFHFSKLRIAVSQDTSNKQSEQQLNHFLETIVPAMREAEHQLSQKLLAGGLQPQGMEIALKKMRAQATIFRQENLPLATQEQKYANEYAKITAAQSVQWEGQELTTIQLNLFQQNPDRQVREQTWRLEMQRHLQDREALNALWVKLLNLRVQIAANAGFTNYRDYRWQQLNRFDYTPADCETFHAAIEEVVVPAAKRIYARKRQQLGVDTLRPWDLVVDPLGRPPLKPFETVTEFEDKGQTIFNRVDPQLGGYFATMRQENLLDLMNRQNKAPGGYCAGYPSGEHKRPFIFMNAVGQAHNVTTLLHEAGHSFHFFEVYQRLNIQQERWTGSEFNEVASMSMELLGAPYLAQSEGGYYTQADTARARIEHLENIILLWSYIAVVDAFQLWVYTNTEAASDPTNCDRKWLELWTRFRGGEDWSGLENEEMTGWHRKLHIFQLPFYYIEYGIAQLGAAQIWAHALENQSQAVTDYRHALSLGGTVSLPDLYAAAGVKFALDATTLRTAVDLMERTITELEAV